MVLPPDSAQADTQHPQFGMTLTVTQDSHMLTHAGMAFPRLPANVELTSRRREAGSASSAFLRENVCCLSERCWGLLSPAA